MKVEKQQDPVLDVIELSHLFMTEYLPMLDGNATRVYLYLLYLTETDGKWNKATLAAILNVDVSVVEAAFVQLCAGGLISVERDTVRIEHLARKEIERTHRPRTSKRPDEEELTRGGDKARSQMIRAVSDRFFSGQMPNSWYGEIDLWISKYGFAPEVVFMLFQHCAQNNAVTKPYMRKVAENWGLRYHIRTAEQLEQYFKTYDEFDKIRKEICKKLHIQAPLTEYQNEYIERWFYTYGYRLEIVNLALKEGAGMARPTFNLYEKILKDWYDRGLRTPQDVKAHLAQRRKKSGDGTVSVPQKDNYSGRTYDQAFFDRFYKEDEQA